MMGMVIITFLQQLMLVLLGQIAFGVDYFNSPVALFMTMISLSVLAASIGLLISAVFRSEPPVIATTVISRPIARRARRSLVPAGSHQPAVRPGGALLPQRLDHGLPPRHSAQGLGRAGRCLAPCGFVWIWIVVLFALAVWRFRPE